MSQYCFQSTTKTKNKLSNLTILCTFILSHPLYFSYLIFFSPYLFKLLSFLSPLFFTTSLLFLSLLTTLIPLHSFIDSNESFVLTAYKTLLENSNPEFEGDEDGRSHCTIEESEVYKVVFEIPTIEVRHENPIHNDEFQENPIDVFVEKVGEKSDSKCESLTMKAQEKVCTKPKEMKEEEEDEVIKKELIITRWESDEIEVYKTPKSWSLKVDEGKKLSDSFSQTVGGQTRMGSFGSNTMKREKEWRRTLACKLFEERHNGSNNNMSFNGGGGDDDGESEEGMDLLWETYETESNRGKSKERESKKGIKEERIEELMMKKDYDTEDDYDDDVSENGKFCCLQALKLSAGKMNMSMGMRFSKALKGIGLLQSHVRKQGRKGYK